MCEVAVIGCGVIGLTTAIAVQNKLGKSVKVTIYSKDFSPNLTSDIAAGLWTPYLLEKTPEDLVMKWGKATQDYILKLWKEGKADECGISLQPIIVLTDNPEDEVPAWVNYTLGYYKLNEKDLADLRKKFKQNVASGYVYVSFVWEAPIFLPYLEKQFVSNGGEIVKKEIKCLEELAGNDVIINCPGLGALSLVNDNKMKPVRGQIAKVSAPWQFHSMMLDFGRGNYIIPNARTVILGGTKQKGDFNTDPYEEDTKHIFEGCGYFVPSLKEAPVVRHYVGLRPSRESVRLDTEVANLKGRTVRIVHNYGHGGSGVTLCVGCAEDAASLVENIVEDLLKSKL